MLYCINFYCIFVRPTVQYPHQEFVSFNKKYANVVPWQIYHGSSPQFFWPSFKGRSTGVPNLPVCPTYYLSCGEIRWETLTCLELTFFPPSCFQGKSVLIAIQGHRRNTKSTVAERGTALLKYGDNSCMCGTLPKQGKLMFKTSFILYVSEL